MIDITSSTSMAFGIAAGVIINIMTSKSASFLKWRALVYFLLLVPLIHSFYLLYTAYCSSICNYEVWLAAIGSLAMLGLVFYFFNHEKDLVSYEKLLPKVISFTQESRKDEIRLWGGDLNFFGLNNQMNDNPQYKQLVEKKFEKILILCQKPKQTETQKRFGKIIQDLKSSVEFRFYNKKSPDLDIRGRIKKKQSPDIYVALIYGRIDSGKYKILEADITKGEHSQMYMKVWDMCWASAEKVSDAEVQLWLSLL